MSGETNTTASLKEAIPSGFNCPDGDIFSLPTKADLINTFNEIASIPGKLQAKVLEMKAEKEKEIAELTEKMKTIDDPDELKKIQEEIKGFSKFRWQVGGVLIVGALLIGAGSRLAPLFLTAEPQQVIIERQK